MEKIRDITPEIERFLSQEKMSEQDAFWLNTLAIDIEKTVAESSESGRIFANGQEQVGDLRILPSSGYSSPTSYITGKGNIGGLRHICCNGQIGATLLSESALTEKSGYELDKKSYFTLAEEFLSRMYNKPSTDSREWLEQFKKDLSRIPSVLEERLIEVPKVTKPFDIAGRKIVLFGGSQPDESFDAGKILDRCKPSPEGYRLSCESNMDAITSGLLRRGASKVFGVFPGKGIIYEVQLVKPEAYQTTARRYGS